MRGIVRRGVVGLLAFGVSILLLWLLVDPFGPVGDEIALERERVRRRAIYAARESLPGTPDPTTLQQRLAEQRLVLGSPVFVRIFKREFELEVWLKRDGQFHRFATYPVCRFSGGLGPKLREGDRQSPEGFYTVDAKALNPQSRWHKSFNVGYPNAYDRVHGRTGSYVMVHGGCSSVGCFAMTNGVIDEIWTLVTAALRAGQPRFQVQALPFRMSEAAMAARSGHAQAEFWADLKRGSDAFEATGLPPRVQVCRGRYVTAEQTAPASDGSSEIAAGCPNEPARAENRVRQRATGRRS